MVNTFPEFEDFLVLVRVFQKVKICTIIEMFPIVNVPIVKMYSLQIAKTFGT